MFSLKVDDPSAPADHPIELWFPGVTKVSVLWRGTIGSTEQVGHNPPNFGSYGGHSDYTYIGGGPRSAAFLFAQFNEISGPIDSEGRFMLVARAWLIGPNGTTVDRIAP